MSNYGYPLNDDKPLAFVIYFASRGNHKTKYMKKVLPFLILVTGFLLSCEEDNDIKAIESENLTITKPDNIISVLDAASLVDEYVEKRAKFLENNLTQKSSMNDYLATQLVYIKLDDLKNYITYVEQESAKAGIEVESIGMYHMKYPDNGTIPSGKTFETERYGKENLILSPMAFFDDADYEISYALQSTEEGTEAIPVGYVIDHLRGEKQHGEHTYKIGKTIKSLALNDSPWRPPPHGNDSDY